MNVVVDTRCRGKNWNRERRVPKCKRLAALTVVSLLFVARMAQATGLSSQTLRSFAFPVTFANGLTADLVVPAGSTSSLRFDVGKVAIGELPVPLPGGARRRGRRGREFVRPAEIGSHARLLLTGVVDGDGHPVTNTGNEVVIDAVVSPNGAATAAPPFVIPFYRSFDGRVTQYSFHSLSRDLSDIRHGRIDEGMRSGPGDRSGHVWHAVM